MTTKKRVLALVLVCLMALSLGTIATYAASYTDVPATHERFEAIDSLSSSDIITGFPDGTFKPDESVTRAQMAALITRMFQLSGGSVDAMPFSDVAKDHWASSNIVAAKTMGVINGFPDGTFKPDDKVTYEQAVKMIVSSLNYGSAAEAKGGWPNGYIQQASTLGITKKAIMAQADPSPRGMVAQLLFNSMTVDMLVPVVKPDGSVEYQKSSSPNTIQGQYLGATTLNNVVVVAIPNVTLGSTELYCQADEIWVQSGSSDPIKLKVGTKATAKDLIGQTVDIDYKEDTQTKDLVIQRIVAKTSNKTYTIDVSNIEKISDDNSFIEYYAKKDDDKTTKLSFSNTVNTIYNERYASDGLDLLKADMASETALNVSGTLTIVVGSNNTIIKIKSYKTYFVSSSPDTAKNEITVDLPAGSASSAIISVPVNDTTTNQIVIKKKSGDTYSDLSTNPTLSSISRNSLISVAQSKDKKYHEILIGPSPISGVITEQSTDGSGRKTVTISSKVYTVAEGLEKVYPNLFNSIKYDANGTYYVDCFGYIAWATNISTGNVKNGLLLYVDSTGSGLSKVTTAKFLDLKLKTEFTVTIESDDEVNGDLSKLKNKGNRLFNMTISSNNKVKAGDIEEVGTTAITNEDGTSTVQYLNHSATSDDYKVKYSNNKYLFNNQEGLTLANLTTIVKPLLTTDDSDKKFTFLSMTPEIEYIGRHYTVTENSVTNNYIVINTLEQLLDTSPVYIVKEKGSSRSVGDEQVVAYTLFDLKSGSEKSINILENVSNTIGLVKGDVFTYYKTSTKTDIEIDAIKNVTVLLKINKALATSKTVSYTGDTIEFGVDKSVSTADSINGKLDGFSSFSIFRDKVYDYNVDSSYTYSLQLPIVYNNESSANDLYLATKRSLVKTVSSVAYLPDNIITAGVDFASDQDMINKIDNILVKPILSGVKYYVYNQSETEEAKKLVAVTTQEELNGLLDNLRTIKDVKEDTQNADLVYTAIQNYTTPSLKSVYIIKR